jgi:putative MATE family efflux protein
MQPSGFWDKTSLQQLVKLALPVIATSFMSMAYNFVNMIFVGRLGSDAVAAVGTAGFYMNLSWGISSLLTVGAGIKVSHSIGEKNVMLAKSYVRSGIQAILVIALLYYMVLLFSSNFLIHIVGLNNPELENAATSYLLLIGLSIPFSYQNFFFTSVFIGYGDSRTPFRINTIALVLNIILDPLLIYTAGLGINGAAIATVVSQGLATFLFYKKLHRNEELRPKGISYRPVLLKNIIGLGISPTI